MYNITPDIDEPLQMKRGGVTYFYQRDALGSIASLSDNTGNKLKTYRYDSFGNIVSETGTVDNPYIYTGRERDSETGLYYYRARYYDPQLGRFLNEDPIGFGSGDTNFYAYVGNNPTNFIDPSGKIIPLLVAGGVIGGLLVASPLEEVQSTFERFVNILEGVVTGATVGAAARQCAVQAIGRAFRVKPPGSFLNKVLNKGRFTQYLRIGISRGVPGTGRAVFRAAGELVPGGKIQLLDLGPISKIFGILPAAEMGPGAGVTLPFSESTMGN